MTSPIPPHLVRHNAVGKLRRAYGDPVAAVKQFSRFIADPVSPPPQLTSPLSIFDPDSNNAAVAANKLVFHSVGDVGGIHGTATQDNIAAAMENQVPDDPSDPNCPRFLYLLGDVVYFNGQQSLYKTEFYEPYQYYKKLIFAIAGNHDGDTHVLKNDPPDTEPSLFGFNSNFCDSAPNHASPYRQTMTQPYVYWTLNAPFVTIIGLYSNVEGSLDARGRNDQLQFLIDQLGAADPTAKLIVAVHHPPYSLDSAHGGTPDILNALDYAVQQSGRQPDAILSGHVHNYQRFSRRIGDLSIPYIVAGAGGYANDARSMHKLQRGIENEALPFQTTHPDVSLESFEQEQPGFLRVTASPGSLLFEYFVVDWNDSTIVNLKDSVQA